MDLNADMERLVDLFNAVGHLIGDSDAGVPEWCDALEELSVHAADMRSHINRGAAPPTVTP